MEQSSRKKLLRAPPNLSLNNHQHNNNTRQNINQIEHNNFLRFKQSPTQSQRQQLQLRQPSIGVSSCNLSRIADRTQRTEFNKEQESILNDFGVLLNDDQKTFNNNDQFFQISRRKLSQYQQPQEYQQQSQQLIQNDYQQEQLAQFMQKYQKVLQILLANNNNTNKTNYAYTIRQAHDILTQLIQSIKQIKTIKTQIQYDVLQNIVFNYWKVGSQLYLTNNNQQNNKSIVRSRKELAIQQKHKIIIIDNIIHLFQILQQSAQLQTIKQNRLTTLCLILSKQAFKEKDIPKALQWCQKGFMYTPKHKNTSILLKLHYMKSKIYQQINAYEPQLQQIKKCLFLIKSLSKNTTQNKQFSFEFIKSLNKRKQQLMLMVTSNNTVSDYNKIMTSGGFSNYSMANNHNYNKSSQKQSISNFNSSLGKTNNNGSLNKFRKRSISLTKIKALNDQIQPNLKSASNMLKNTFKSALQKQMQSTINNNNAYNLNTLQARKDFLKLDISNKNRLKKKGQTTMTVWEKNSQKITFQSQINKQLQRAAQSLKKQQSNNIIGGGNSNINGSNNIFGNMLLKRPNERNSNKVSTVNSYPQQLIQPIVNIRNNNKRLRNNAQDAKSPEIGQDIEIDDNMMNRNRDDKQQSPIMMMNINVINNSGTKNTYNPYNLHNNNNNSSRNNNNSNSKSNKNKNSLIIKSNNSQNISTKNPISNYSNSSYYPQSLSRQQQQLLRYISTIQEQTYQKYIHKLSSSNQQQNQILDKVDDDYNNQQQPNQQTTNEYLNTYYNNNNTNNNNNSNDKSKSNSKLRRGLSINNNYQFPIQEESMQEQMNAYTKKIVTTKFKQKNNNMNSDSNNVYDAMLDKYRSNENKQQRVLYYDNLVSDEIERLQYGNNNHNNDYYEQDEQQRVVLMSKLGKINQLTVQVRQINNNNMNMKRYNDRLQQQQRGYILNVQMRVNQDQYYQLQLYFINNTSTQSNNQNNNNLQTQFNQWLLSQSINQSTNSMDRNKNNRLKQTLKQQQLQKDNQRQQAKQIMNQLINKQPITTQTNIKHSLISTILNNIHINKNQYLGYTRVQQISIFNNDQYDIQRETELFEYRERNFQYLPQPISIIKSTSNLLTINWKSTTTKSIPILQGNNHYGRISNYGINNRKSKQSLFFIQLSKTYHNQQPNSNNNNDNNRQSNDGNKREINDKEDKQLAYMDDSCDVQQDSKYNKELNCYSNMRESMNNNKQQVSTNNNKQQVCFQIVRLNIIALHKHNSNNNNSNSQQPHKLIKYTLSKQQQLNIQQNPIYNKISLNNNYQQQTKYLHNDNNKLSQSIKYQSYDKQQYALDDESNNVYDLSARQIQLNKQQLSYWPQYNNTLTAIDQHKLYLIELLYAIISNSYFPQLKYLQLLTQTHSYSFIQMLNHLISLKYTSNSNHQPELSDLYYQPKLQPFIKNSYHNNQQYQNNFQQQYQNDQPLQQKYKYKITILDNQPEQVNLKKKGSVRKSQIIQLNQSLNQTSLLQELLRAKTTPSHFLQSQPSHFLQQAINNKTFQSPVKNQHKQSLKIKPIILSQCEQEQNQSSRSYSQQQTPKHNKNHNTQHNNHNTFIGSKSLYQSTIKNKLSNFMMVKILKKALIQPDYKKSPLLMTYFDSISVQSFCNIMGNRPNYIKLTCFRLKTIYVESQQKINFYYLFQLQQREARTRMHKFIIGDQQVVKLIYNQGGRKKFGNNKENTNMIHTTKHTKTLPQKKKILLIKSQQEAQIQSDEQNVHHLESATSSNLRTKRSIFDKRSQKKRVNSNFQSIDDISEVQISQFMLKFTQSSLTQIMKFITPLFVIKKDYIYTSIYLDSKNKLFYLMNRFTIEHQGLTPGEGKLNGKNDDGQFITMTNKKIQPFESPPKSIPQKHNNNLNSFHSHGLYSSVKKQQRKNDFLNKEIKSKKILCQKSLILTVTQSFIYELQKENKVRHNKPSHKNKKQRHSKDKSKNKVSQHKEDNIRQVVYQQLFSILTIIKICKSQFFTIKLYIPKFQRSYTITLDKQFMNYLQINDLKIIFSSNQETKDIINQLEDLESEITEQKLNKTNNPNKLKKYFDEKDIIISRLQIKKCQLMQTLSQKLFEQDNPQQKILWNNVLSIIKIQQRRTQDKVYLVMKISQFSGFVKDCSFLQYFEKDSCVYMIEMSISKKSHNSNYFPKDDFLESLQGNKIKRGLLTGCNLKSQQKNKKLKNHKNSLQSNKHYRQSLIDAQLINSHNQEFQNVGFIYQSKTEVYTLYIQIFRILDEEKEERIAKRRATNKQSICERLLMKGKEMDEVGMGSQELMSGGLEDGGQISARVFINNKSRNNEISDKNNNKIKNQKPSKNNKGSNVSFPNIKSNSKLPLRKQVYQNTIKSTIKSINFNLQQNSCHQVESNNNIGFSRMSKRLKSNYKRLTSHYNKNEGEGMLNSYGGEEINKINLSFYLSEMNNLFKYIDENYSEQFNEQYFIQSQINTGLKILGNIVIEQFKQLSDNKRRTNHNNTLRTTTHLNTNKIMSKQRINKRSDRIHFEDDDHNQQQKIGRDNKVKKKTININNNSVNNNAVNMRKLSQKLSYQNGENNQIRQEDQYQGCKIIGQKQFKQQDNIENNKNTLKQCSKQRQYEELNNLNTNTMNNNTNNSNTQQQQNNNTRRQPTILIVNNSNNRKQEQTKRLQFSTRELFSQFENQKIFKQKLLHRLVQFDQKLKQLQQEQLKQQETITRRNNNNNNKIDNSNNRNSKQSIESNNNNVLLVEQKRQKFTSLHSKLSNTNLIDLHILSTSHTNKISSLFHHKDSLLFLISSIQQYQIYTISIVLDQSHPFHFINLLTQKQILNCIRNRLFTYYSNLLNLVYTNK